MNEALRRSAAHVFVADLGAPVLTDEDAHHLSRVLRLRDGQAVSVCDGKGSWRPCTWQSGALVPAGEVVVEPRTGPELCVALAPVKGDHTDDAVEKLVEIGIDRIIVLAPVDHSVVRWDDARAANALARYRRIVRAAASQSRRTVLPTVEGPVALADVLSREGCAMAEPGGPAGMDGVTTVVIGPEGGFSAAEIAMAPRTVGLGDSVLRAGTAAVVAGALMVAHPRR